MDLRKKLEKSLAEASFEAFYVHGFLWMTWNSFIKLSLHNNKQPPTWKKD